MRRFLVLLVVAALASAAVPAANGDVVDDLLQSSLNDLIAWDPEFATFDPPPSSGHDFVVGSQKVTLPGTTSFQHIRVSAHSGPAGEDPKGSVKITYREPTFPGGAGDLYGDVICLTVFSPPFFVPATAFVWARLRQPVTVYQPYLATYTFVQLQIQDLGNPGPFMGQSPDRAWFLLSQAAPPPGTLCGASGRGVTGDASGNFIVKDAAPTG